MPIFATLMLGLFQGMVEVFTRWFSERVAITAAAIAAGAALLLALTAAISGGIAAVTLTLPADSGILTGLYFAIPNNGPAAVAFCIAVDAACAVYRIGMSNVRIVTG